MNTRSDTLYRQLFAHPEIVRDLLAGFLPALRMQVYVGLLLQDLVAQHRLTRRGKLPPVLPIVLYHGRDPWRASRELADLMLAPPAGLEAYQPRQQYMLIDQHRHMNPDDPANILGIVFRLLRSKTNKQMLSALSAFAERMKAPDIARARDSLTRWVCTTLQDEFDEANMSLGEEPVMLFNRRFKTYEALLEYEAVKRGRLKGLKEGRRKGLRQGIQQGMQQGRVEGLQEALYALLAGRNASLPAELAEKVADADAAQLSAWIEALSDGRDPAQIFTAANHSAA